MRRECLFRQIVQAAIAQLGKRQTEDLKVPGSIPGLGILGCGVKRKSSQRWLSDRCVNRSNLRAPCVAHTNTNIRTVLETFAPPFCARLDDFCEARMKMIARRACTNELNANATNENPDTRNRTRDHLMAANVYSQMLCQLSYVRRHMRLCFNPARARAQHRN